MIETEFKYKRSNPVDDVFISLRKAKIFRRISLFFILFALLISACAPTSKTSPTTLPPTITLIATLPAEIQATPTAAPTEAPTETSRFTIDAQKLPPEQAAAMKAHAGLEASIRQEADGRYTTTMTVLTAEGQQTQQQAEVKPDTLHEDIASKNKYGNTPVMETVDGKKLYWVQEEKGWFAVELSPDINKPVFVPFDQREVALRVVIAEFNQPFSQAALDHWKRHDGILYTYSYLEVNANTHESTVWAFLKNAAMQESDLTLENAPVQNLAAWFWTQLPDGTTYEYFPTKWLDPADPNNPQNDEWKVIMNASGQEIMGNSANREKFDALVSPSGGTPKYVVVPIFRAKDNFFNGTNNLITFNVAQPSLAKLLSIPSNDLGNLVNPHSLKPDGSGETKLNFWFDHYFPMATAENANFGDGLKKDNIDYDSSFLPDDVQTLLFPSIVVLK